MPNLKSWKPPKPKLYVSIIAFIIGIIGILLILYSWQLPPFFLGVVNTNDAYIGSKTTMISPQVSGYITDIYVKDFANVKKGDLILQIDKRIFTQKVNEAEANLEKAQATLESYGENYRLNEANVEAKKAVIATNEAILKNANSENNRVEKLVKRGSLSKKEQEDTYTTLKKAQYSLAQSKAEYQQALEQLKAYEVNKAGLEADVKKMQALLALAQIDLDNSLIKAPVDGKLGVVGAKLGQFVSQGTTLTFLVPSVKWVEANFKETKMTDVKIGQEASFTVDALGGVKIKGVVEDISPATGSEFNAVKVNNATGNFIKVVQRIPVRIKIDENDPNFNALRAGMSVEATIYVNGKKK